MDTRRQPKGAMGQFCTTLSISSSGHYRNLHVIKLHRATHARMGACTPGEIGISLGSITPSPLPCCASACGCVRCDHCGGLGGGGMDF